MILKDDVEIAVMTRENLTGILIAAEVFWKRGYSFTITSLTDGIHKDNSKHYSGNAFDLRIWSVPEADLRGLVLELRAKLRADYDVILEGDHIHVEYDKK